MHKAKCNARALMENSTNHSGLNLHQSLSSGFQCSSRHYTLAPETSKLAMNTSFFLRKALRERRSSRKPDRLL